MIHSLSETQSFSPIFTELLSLRGLTEVDEIRKFITPDLNELHDPFLMKGMTEAVNRIRKAVAEQELILVHGDYDVDGITGATLIAKMLKALGAKFEVFLPDRKRDGYGVSARAISEGKERGVSLFITVDCGITAKEQIALANSLGLEVIIVDHHRIPEEGVPEALSILDPLQSDCPYPFKELSAAGLAFKLAWALLGAKAKSFLDLAALSTIGDVAPLQGENRAIVAHGLMALSARLNLGVKALASVSKISSKEINVGHIGFMLAPRINAAGRMSSPEIAFQLLMSEHAPEAESLAFILDEENKARQKEERQTTKEAILEVERTMNFSRDRVIVVGRQGWHAGVIGIVAARLVDKFHRPALVVAFDGEMGKASARSIKGFHLFNTLQASKDHLEAFGGHEQAAGFSIFEKNLEPLRKSVNEYAAENYTGEIFVRKVKTDMEIRLDQITSTLGKELKLMEPHGMGNPRPTFITRNLKLKGRAEKKYSYVYRFFVTDGVRTMEASWNDRAQEHTSFPFKEGEAFDLAYGIKTNFWDGIESFVLEVKAILQPAEVV